MNTLILGFKVIVLLIVLMNVFHVDNLSYIIGATSALATIIIFKILEDI